MQKINNLNELIDLVGKETVDKCFAEYMTIIDAKSNKDDIEYLREFNISVESFDGAIKHIPSGIYMV